MTYINFIESFISFWKKKIISSTFPSSSEGTMRVSYHFLLLYPPSHPPLKNEKKFIIGAWNIPSSLRSLSSVPLKGSQSCSISLLPNLSPETGDPNMGNTTEKVIAGK